MCMKFAVFTWLAVYSNIWHQNDRINIVCYSTDSDIQISRLVARNGKMNDYERIFVKNYQMT